jgi:hypothetical protein
MEQYWMDKQDIWLIELVKLHPFTKMHLESKFVSLAKPKLTWGNQKIPASCTWVKAQF